jgi:hypothetical protein
MNPGRSFTAVAVAIATPIDFNIAGGNVRVADPNIAL